MRLSHFYTSLVLILVVAGGETVEVTFTALEQPGRYDYLCSFMVHFTAGMRGTLITI